jgi:enoyl-CoA hydratase/carnithine racemase
MSEAPVLLSQENKVLTIAFNRPDKKNALTQEMYGIAADAIIRAEQDNDCRVVLMTGTKECFTSGNDINDFLNSSGGSGESPVIRFLFAIARFNKPLMAAVNGPAIGVGTTMLLHCDLVVAAEKALFQLPFATLGLCPEAGSSYLLAELVGHQKAAELLMLGEAFNADEALSYKLINRLSTEDNYQQEALLLAQQLAAMPPKSIRMTKALMKQRDQEVLEAAMQAEFDEFAVLLAAPEAVEAMTAFMERRPADFSKF